MALKYISIGKGYGYAVRVPDKPKKVVPVKVKKEPEPVKIEKEDSPKADKE